MITGSPIRRFTSVYDLENQVGTVDSRFTFPGTCPVYCTENAWFPYFDEHRSTNFIGSHQRLSRTCIPIVPLRQLFGTLDFYKFFL